MNLKSVLLGAIELVAGLFTSNKTETITHATSARVKSRDEYQHRRTGKQKITRSSHVQRIDGKTIIHNDPRGGITPEQRQRGFNKILSLHAMFIQRANLTAELRK